MNGPDEPGETEQTRVLGETAARWMQIADEHMKPVDRYYAERATNIEPDRRRALGDANVETQRAFGDARRLVEEGQGDVGGARLKSAVVNVNRDAGISKGLNEADVNAAVENQAVANRAAVIDTGLGEAAEGAAGIGTAARISLANASADAQASAARRSGISSLAGAAAGIGVGANASKAAPLVPRTKTLDDMAETAQDFYFKPRTLA
jgi:hypothetical protein